LQDTVWDRERERVRQRDYREQEREAEGEGEKGRGRERAEGTPDTRRCDKPREAPARPNSSVRVPRAETRLTVYRSLLVLFTKVTFKILCKAAMIGHELGDEYQCGGRRRPNLFADGCNICKFEGFDGFR
jgi:hypothetical protein